MKHHASSHFWAHYQTLPEAAQRAADSAFALLRVNPQHPSLHLKKVGAYRSVRIGRHYRALAIEVEDGLLWFWVGSHADYDRMVR